MSILDQTKAKMAAAIEHLKEELKAVRTGRANPAILDHVVVEMYGSSMKIKELASITCPEARLILITPFDAKSAGTIGKAIEKANLNLQPIVDGNAIRIKLPQMDEAMRKEMIKLCYKRCEEAKVGIRNIRRDANETARKQKASGDINEDVMKKWEKSIQEFTDKSCKEADDMTQKKEKEVMTV